MNEEEWKPIPGFDGYEVSDLGRVRSWYDRSLSLRETPLVLKQTRLGKTPYLRVGLRRDRKNFTKRVHHLVLEAFVGPRPEGLIGCHGDGDPTNNQLSNLRWDTPQANSDDRVKHGNAWSPVGEARSVKLTNDDVCKIRARRANGERVVDLSAEFGMSKAQISRICTRKRWQHLE